MGRVLVGCSGWQYKDWRGVLYPPRCPQRDWLEVYARRFGTVEVNSSFYRLPKRDAVARWTQQVPEGFVFTIKVSRYLTHIKRLTTVGEGIATFAERIEPIAERGCLGPLLWQLPPNFKRDDERLRAALDELPPGRHAFEFRERSWFADDVYALLAEHGVATVVADDARRPLPVPPPTADFAFIRFHWATRGRRGNYSDAEIDEWAERIADLRRGREVFAYYNNDWEGFAVRNALRLRELMGAPPPAARAQR
jgi:uncharacterized protein YecE (DUF72 family)